MQLLEFGVMSEEDMAEYLGQIKRLEEDIPQILREEYARAESLESCIRMNSFHDMPSDGIPGSGGIKTDTAYYTLRAAYNDLEKQMDDLAAEITQVTMGQNKLSYVVLCIKLLPCDLADIIYSQYIRKEKAEEYARKKGFSRATVFKKRKMALEKLVELYNARFDASSAPARQDVDALDA